MLKRPPLFIFLLSLLAILSLSCNREKAGHDYISNLPTAAVVEEAIDGDTIRVEGGMLVRYIGIDAPELRRRGGNGWVYDPRPFSKESYDLNRRLVEGKRVRLEYDKERVDRYNRALAYIYVDDLFVNGEIVREGLAKVSIYPPNTKYSGLLIRFEKDAQGAKRGIWEMEKSKAQSSN